MLQPEIWRAGKLFINHRSAAHFVITHGGGDVISACASSGGFFSQFSFQAIQRGGAIGRHYADFMQVLRLRRANRFCGKSAKERVESAMAATAYLMVFMINLSQVILFMGRCSVDVMSITVFAKDKIE